jgi:hypothetical protein
VLSGLLSRTQRITRDDRIGDVDMLKATRGGVGLYRDVSLT